MPYKVTFFWQQQSEMLGGWSESFWQSAATANEALTRALALLVPLNQMHGNQSVCPTIRISEVGTFRRVLLHSRTYGVEPVGSADFDSDYVTTALLIRLKSSTGRFTRQWVRGLPDGAIANGGRLKLIPRLLTNFGIFTGIIAITANGWVMRLQSTANPLIPVANVSVAGVVTAAAHGFATNDMVRITRGKTNTYINRLWRVTAIDANSFSLQNYFPPIPYPIQTGFPMARKVEYIYEPVADVNHLRATSHKTGRPFGQLGGRRKSRRLLPGTAPAAP